MKSIAILKVGRDYGVVFLDLRIAGLKSRGEIRKAIGPTRGNT